LQEVGQSWVGPLQIFFAKQGYHVIYAPYGHKDSDYFGVLTAFPTERYDLEALKIQLPVDTKAWSKDEVTNGLLPSRDNILKWTLLVVLFWWVLWIYGLYIGFKLRMSRSEKAIVPHWKNARNRWNKMILACLRQKSTGKPFIVANYHMPCAYKTPQVMVIHSALTMSMTQKFSKENGDIPYVFCGDFNFQPNDVCYNFFSTGVITKLDKHFPILPADDDWRPSLSEPVDSAYRKLNNMEPVFTNRCTHVGDEEVFCGTLDYLFIRRDIRVKKTLALPDLDNVKGLYPNAEEPSDHLMIGATLALPN